MEGKKKPHLNLLQLDGLQIFITMADSIQLKEGAGDYRLLSMEVIFPFKNERIKPFH